MKIKLRTVLLCVLSVLCSHLAIAQKSSKLSPKEILIDQSIICFSNPNDVISDFGSPTNAGFIANKIINDKDSLTDSALSTIVLEYPTMSFYFVQKEDSQYLYRVEVFGDTNTVSLGKVADIKVGGNITEVAKLLSAYIKYSDKQKIGRSKEAYRLILNTESPEEEDGTTGNIDIKVEPQGNITEIVVSVKYNDVGAKN